MTAPPVDDTLRGIAEQIRAARLRHRVTQTALARSRNARTIEAEQDARAVVDDLVEQYVSHLRG